LSQIRDLVAVVESGSIRAAARRLGVSQPGITKSIQSLEAELHVQLVRRTPHGVVTTPSGRAFLARAQVAQAELRKAQEEAAQLDGAGAVSVGVGPTSAFQIVPRAVARFRAQFPGARLRILEGVPRVLLPLVRDETLDLATGPRPDGELDAALVFRPLFREDVVVMVRKAHPLRGARSLTELDGAEWLSLIPRGSPQAAFNRAFSSVGLPAPQPVMQCESYNTVVGLLANSDMLGIMSRRLAAERFAREVLQQVAVAEPLPSYTVGMFTRRTPPLTRAAAAMAKAVVSAARELAHES
jgi:DNA-binding transcriptional LysR family regulator